MRVTLQCPTADLQGQENHVTQSKKSYDHLSSFFTVKYYIILLYVIIFSDSVILHSVFNYVFIASLLNANVYIIS